MSDKWLDERRRPGARHSRVYLLVIGALYLLMAVVVAAATLEGGGCG